MENNITTVVGTCDSYLNVVPNFITLYNKYYEPSTRRLIVGETEKIDTDGFEWVLPGILPWGERMKIAIETVTTDYIFLLLEDYYLSQKLTVEYIEYLIAFMDRFKADKLSIFPMEAHHNKYSEIINTIYKIDINGEFMSNLQPAIWRTEEFLRVVQPHYSPWDFEMYAQGNIRGIKDNYYLVKVDIPIYFNFVRRGNVLSAGAEDFLRDQCL
jgi:hypothetical protein